MRTTSLSIVELQPPAEISEWRPFALSPHFEMERWGGPREVHPTDLWLSARMEGDELARCMLIYDRQRTHSRLLGETPHGWLDLVGFEVAKPYRGRGIGRAVVDAIRDRYPQPRFTARVDQDLSRGFWERIAWRRIPQHGPLAVNSDAGLAWYEKRWSDIGQVAGQISATA